MCLGHSRHSVAISCDILTTWQSLSSVTLIVIQLIYIFYGMIYASGKYSPDYITSNQSGLSESTLYDTRFTASESSQSSSCQPSLNTTCGCLMLWAFLAWFLVVPSELMGTLNTHVLFNSTAMPPKRSFLYLVLFLLFIYVLRMPLILMNIKRTPCFLCLGKAFPFFKASLKFHFLLQGLPGDSSLLSHT